MKMNQVQSIQKIGDTAVPSPEMRPIQTQANNSTIFQSAKIAQLSQSAQSIQSTPFTQVRDISPLTHKQLNALSPSKSTLSQGQKKRNHKIPCPAHQEFDISNMCTAEGCLEPLCAECIRVHTQLHNNEGTSSNIDTIFNKRDQCIEILKEQTNLFSQEIQVLGQIGDSTRDNLLKQSLEKIQIAKEKVLFVVEQYFKDIQEHVQQKIVYSKQSTTVDKQKNLELKLQSIIQDIAKMEDLLNSEDFIKAIIQILSGEYDHNYEKIQQEINEVVEKSGSELFEVEFDESKMYSLNIEIQKLIFLKPHNMDGVINKTLEISKADVFQSKHQSPLKKHNQTVLSTIVSHQQRNNFSSNQKLNSQSFLQVGNHVSQANENINRQSLQNIESLNDLNKPKTLISQRPPQSQQLQKSINQALSNSQISKSSNIGLDQFMHLPKSQRQQQQQMQNGNLREEQIQSRQPYISSNQPSLNLSRDSSPNRNSVKAQDQVGLRGSRSISSNIQYEGQQKKMYTFNEVTTFGQQTDREISQQQQQQQSINNSNSVNSMRKNNHIIRSLQNPQNIYQEPQRNFVSSNSQEKYTPYTTSNPSSQRPSVSQHGDERISQSQNIENSQLMSYPQILLEQADYFSPQTSRKFLHFFQDNSKIFHYLDLETLSKDSQTQQFQQQILNIQFKIPMYHRSVMTPFGDTYITGGVDVNQKSYVLNTCYKLNYRQATLEPISSMYYPRSNHGIAFCEGYIYVCGGSTNQDNTCLDKCERFDVEIGRWEQISSLNQKCSGCSLSQFSNRFLFKFGGNTDIFTLSNTIERYDIQLNEWKIIPFNIIPNHITMKLPSFCGSCQVNKDEIILLGGSNHSNKLQNVFLIRMYSEECDVILLKPLPRAGTFWQNPIVLGGVIFSLQNIIMDKSPDHCYFGKKRILAFNSQIWKQIGSDEIDYYNSSNSANMVSSNININQNQSYILDNSYRKQTASKSPYRVGQSLTTSNKLKKVFYD
ncbi:kelch motif protein (macronuclear) [Tetrahymena thermophila SB210]|uniref:Kelch motif protein n=1 Tax=Tetrahymena thermophila (strain SB210) TaxID=312017 RepID=I7LTN5_TETTS|nr:kelch motif protein [Tetrahymena thermophila SB210]EAR85568.1 kelch motif protein [Tetrahymena thermophila SB210]|eukprot:XP_001033231.1 kelch motif protein [Tetrahymena thermophila SB210]